MASESDELPRSDMKRLSAEVLSKGPEAALPGQLSDEWLDLIARDLECLDHLDGDADQSTLTAPMALVIHILAGKERETEETVSADDMLKYLDDYRIEIALETVTRHTHIKADRPTLETIFTDRTVSVVDEAPPY